MSFFSSVVHDVSRIYLLASVFLGCAITVFSFLILLPFYVYVNKVNRKRDEKIPIFPVTNQLYKMVKLIYYLWICLSISSSISIFTQNNLINVAAVWAGVSAFLDIHITVQVCHLYISFLAIQRALLYFFPSFDKCLAKIQSFVSRNIYYTFILFALFNLMSLFGYVLYNSEYSGELKKTVIYLVFLTSFVILNGILYVTSLFYIPIMISVRKFNYLPAARQNNPQFYIAMQTLITVFFKSWIAFPVIFAFIFREYPISLCFFLLPVTDIVIIPVVIQISYLFSNRRNIQTFLASFNLIKLFKVLLDIETAAPVGPSVAYTMHSGQSPS